MARAKEYCEESSARDTDGGYVIMEHVSSKQAEHATSSRPIPTGHPVDRTFAARDTRATRSADPTAALSRRLRSYTVLATKTSIHQTTAG